MDYSEQQQFLRGSRLWGGVMLGALFGLTAAVYGLGDRESVGLLANVLLVIVTLGIFIYYAPDYLHLTVNRQKGPAWAIRIRWRIIGSVLVLGLIEVPS